MSDYDTVPVDGNPFAQAYDTVPVQGNPFNEPSVLSNTWTGVARGLGSLLEGAGQAGLAETQSPPEVTPKPGEIEKVTVSGLTSGQPYVPQSDLGRAYQNIVAGTVSSAPMAALGAGGVVPFLAREGLNIAGNVGGEAGRRMMPDHPIIGGLLGSLLAPLAVGGAVSTATNLAKQGSRVLGTSGAVEREAVDQLSQQPGYNIPMSKVDDFLTQSNNPYWTPGRIAAAPDYQKRQAVQNTLNNSTPVGPPVPQSPISVGGALQHALGGLGLGAGSYLGSHFGVFPGVGEGLGLGIGEVLGHYAKPFMQYRNQLLDYNAQKLLATDPSRIWQLYQQQQAQPSLMQRLGMGVVAPEAADLMSP